jgi:hypothetical protein
MGLGNFANWLMGFAKTFLAWGYNNIISILQGAIDGFAAFCILVVGLFPAGSSVPSPGAVPSDSTWTIVVQCLNWFFPVSYFITVVTFVCTSLVAYFVIAPLARWVKLLT